MRERSNGDLPAPSDEQQLMACAAFEGKSQGEIRSLFRGAKLEDVSSAIRAVREAIRRNETPDRIKKEFPDIVVEQMLYSKTAVKPSVPSLLLAKLRKVAASLTVPEWGPGRFSKWLDEVRAKYGKLGVPITMNAIVQGAERGDPEMVKLSAQIFELTPRLGRAPLLAQQFNLPGGEQKQEKRVFGEARAPYFEQLLRQGRARLGAGSTQGVEQTEREEESNSLV
jgi:hypothetical protein